MQQIGADGVAPAHMAPLVAEGIVLEEEVVLAAKENKSVGIIGPVLARRKVDLRTIGLIVVAALRAGDARGEKKGNATERFNDLRQRVLGHGRFLVMNGFGAGWSRARVPEP